MKFQIFKDKVVFIHDDSPKGKEVIPLSKFPWSDFPQITILIKQSQKKDKDGFTDYGYTSHCIRCGLFDYIVQGYCKPCFDRQGCEYEFERRTLVGNGNQKKG